MGGFKPGAGAAAALVVIIGGAVYAAIELFTLGRLAAVIAGVGYAVGVAVSAIARRCL